MTQSLKTTPKTARKALFLRAKGRPYPKRDGKTRKIPGAVTVSGGNVCPKKFTGKELDPETGLYYFGARYLDPKTSRWLSGDPALDEYVPGAGQGPDKLSGMGGVFNTINLHTYSYSLNNPVKYIDPDGRNPYTRYAVFSSRADPLGLNVCGGGAGGTAVLGTGAFLALGVASSRRRDPNPFPENRHIPPDNRQRSPMGRGTNADPSNNNPGPSFEAPPLGGTRNRPIDENGREVKVESDSNPLRDTIPTTETPPQFPTGAPEPRKTFLGAVLDLIANISEYFPK
jgi:RHS repeat-associated protein